MFCMMNNEGFNEEKGKPKCTTVKLILNKHNYG